MKTNELSLQNTVLSQFMAEIRDIKALIERGRPGHIHVTTVIASEQGFDFVRQHLPDNTTIWAGAIDSELTSRAYIIPGLGDAGDLAYGDKT